MPAKKKAKVKITGTATAVPVARAFRQLPNSVSNNFAMNETPTSRKGKQKLPNVMGKMNESPITGLRKMREIPKTRGAASSLNQIKKMAEMPKRPAKQLLPKKKPR
jgi:hypothetical protein